MQSLVCDGCGQPADQEHIARRMKRLENMTRCRPIHVQALFLGAASPANAGEYLYSARDLFAGESAALLRALSVEVSGRTVDATLTRIRRSFKPKRVVLLGTELEEFVPQFIAANLDAMLVLQNGKPFEWNELSDGLLAKELAAPLQAL